MQIQRPLASSLLGVPASARAAGAPPAPPAAPMDTATPSTLIKVPGLKAGQTLNIAQGQYDGYTFSGQAEVRAYDGKTLDLLVHAQAMLFVKADVHLRFDLAPDGSVRFVGQKVGDGANQAASKLQVKSQKPGQTVFAGANGKIVTLSATANGGLAIAYDQARLTLTP